MDVPSSACMPIIHVTLHSAFMSVQPRVLSFALSSIDLPPPPFALQGMHIIRIIIHHLYNNYFVSPACVCVCVQSNHTHVTFYSVPLRDSLPVYHNACIIAAINHSLSRAFYIGEVSTVRNRRALDSALTMNNCHKCCLFGACIPLSLLCGIIAICVVVTGELNLLLYIYVH